MTRLMPTLQRWLAPWHRWIGLLAGIYLLVVTLTGAALLFRIDIQRALDPALFRPLSDGPLADPAEVLAGLQQVYPHGSIAGLDAPTNRRPTTLAYVDDGKRFLTVLIDPASGTVLGGLPQRPVIRFLHALHFDLTLGRTGRVINGIGAMVLAFMGLSGMVLWWRGSRWRQGLIVRFGRSAATTQRELHSAAGIWSSLALLMWGMTGTVFIFPAPFMKAIGAFSPVESAGPPMVAAQEGVAIRPLHEQLDAARQVYPQRPIARIVLPGNPTVPLQVLFARHAPTQIGESMDTVYVDPWRAEVVGESGKRTAGEALWQSFTTLHVAGFGGYGVRTAWLLFALSPTLLLATGLFTWWWRRRRPLPASPLRGNMR